MNLPSVVSILMLGFSGAIPMDVRALNSEHPNYVTYEEVMDLLVSYWHLVPRDHNAIRRAMNAPADWRPPTTRAENYLPVPKR